MQANDNLPRITIFTIGFTKKTAGTFFEKLRSAGVVKVVDTRLNNESQLAGFTKKEDLKYFLKTILGVDYVHVLEFAPTDEILSAYKKKKITWSEYEIRFHGLISEREIECVFTPAELDKACLLCSEAEPHHCHRRLVAEYLKWKWPQVVVEHL
jgi:uncharacterized protein (DUF488 family)